MVNITELKAEMVRNGYTQKSLAQRIGMTPRTFSNRLKSREFGSTEIKNIIEALNIKNPVNIFFAD